MNSSKPISILERIKSLQPGESMNDEGEKASVKGLQIRGRANKKSFLLYYRTKAGVQRRPRIGDFGPMTLAQARSVAKDILDRVSRGEDPQGGWAVSRGDITLNELFNLAWANHWGRPRYRDSGWAKDVMNFWKKNIQPYFGSRAITQIHPADLRLWHRSFEDRPFAGNRSLEVISKLYRYAEDFDLIPYGCNPCKRVKGFVEKKRKRYATQEELTKILSILFQLLDSENTVRSAAYLLLIVYTGTRPKALEVATKNQLQRISFNGSTIGVLSGKGKTSEDSGDEETVVFSEEALSIVDRIPDRGDNLLVGCKMPKKLWYAVRKQAGCEDLWARDLRRTFATVGMSGGVDKGVIGKLLNHSSQATTDIYAKLDLTARIEATTKISGMISSLKNVVPIR